MTPVQKMITVSFRDGSEASFMLNGSCDNGPNSPYQLWTEENDPEPMILALQNLVTRLENEENYKNNREPAW